MVFDWSNQSNDHRINRIFQTFLWLIRWVFDCLSITFDCYSITFDCYSIAFDLWKIKKNFRFWYSWYAYREKALHHRDLRRHYGRQKTLALTSLQLKPGVLSSEIDIIQITKEGKQAILFLNIFPNYISMIKLNISNLGLLQYDLFWFLYILPPVLTIEKLRWSFFCLS